MYKNFFICYFFFFSFRIDIYLKNILSISRNKIHNIINNKKIFVNNIIINKNFFLKRYDVILIIINNKFKKNIKNIKNIKILYEDNFLIIVNKPTNLIVHPTIINNNNTLINYFLLKYNKLPYINFYRIGIVNRLDKDTTGIVIIAKNLNILLKLQKQFKKRLVKKKYIAIVNGNNMLFKKKIIKNYLLKSKKKKNKVIISNNKKLGKFSITKLKVYKKLKFHTIIKCYPKTGRTHQIRVHLNSINYSIFNDKLYNNNSNINNNNNYKLLFKKSFFILNRHALHSYYIKFTHPFLKKKIILRCNIPIDFKNFILL
ncbi:MAG: RluA family pseudouridine synthase [Candidatus Shikimatogenerans sp. Ttur]|uniref:Pseudouridine synthase n=1 Tax=Candidatus Shikimatogenerans sp. Ttur TaxID=3158569 RepID=A0AAU7ZXK1_9FLAO